jgi:tRNA dimethylallyltransferase
MVKTLIVLAGPTAVGKTTLAIRLAKYYQTEIISADSRQFYREMEVGTAKPSPEELITIKHHFINSHSITDNYSVGDYERDVLKLTESLFNEHDVIILAGGSGLYIDAITNGFDELPSSSKEVRESLNELFRVKGITPLQKRVKDVDPAFYDEVDRCNPQRLIRALEVYETTGKPFSEFRNKIKKQRPFNIVQIGLKISREKLYENINKRVDIMVDNGLVAEAEALKSLRYLNPLNTVGYSELFDYFDGKFTLQEAVEKIKQNTRNFAKRQLTWFNRSKDIKWFDPQDFDSITSHVNSLLEDPERVGRKN